MTGLDIVLPFIAMMIGGPLHRLRGDSRFSYLTGRGAPLARAISAAAIALLCWPVSSWQLALAIFPAAWLGDSLGWYGGLTPDLRGTIIRTLRFVGRVAPTAAVLFYFEEAWWMMLPAALLSSLAYEIGRWLHSDEPGRGWTEVGELLSGSVFSFFVLVAVVY